MEVHQHSHTARKKWSHYFWEFLMLFLAVFCGFFAELQLEHKIENDRMKRFVVQLVNSLEKDSAQLSGMVAALEWKQSFYDTLFANLALPRDDAAKWVRIQKTISVLENPMRYTIRKAAIDQVVSSGYMRLIKNDEIIGELLGYEVGQYMIEKQIDAEVLFVMQIATPFLNKHFDKKRAPQRMGSTIKIRDSLNKTLVDELPENFLVNIANWKQEFENIAITSRERNQTPYRNIKIQLESAVKIIGLLKKEFKLK